MKKIIVCTLLVFCLLVSLAQAAPPTPTVNGTSGLVRMPTADTLGYQEFNLFCHYGMDSTANKGVFRYGANIGTFKTLELGIIGKTDPLTNQMQDGVYINVKYSLASDDELYPLRMALGIENLTSRNDTDIYLVATKHFPAGFNLSFGALFDSPNGSKIRTMGMLGVELKLMGGSVTIPLDALIGESVTQFNLGVRWYITPNLVLSGNAVNLINDPSRQNLDHPTNYIGISWANPF